MTVRWILAGISLVVSILLGNLAISNWWAAGGPPIENPAHIASYAYRGNISFVFACLFFLVFVVLFILNICKGIKEKKEKLIGKYSAHLFNTSYLA
ncbi:MAG: hypothetical protein JXR79_01680 [Nitrospirae bacterium]|nr:hypothetical protein [Nitrospirota bacterium]